MQSSCEFISTITAIACAITSCCSKEEAAYLAITFSQLGSTLSAAIAIEEINAGKDESEKQETNDSNVLSTLDELLL